MIALRLASVVLSLLLLAAHFLRSGGFIVVVLLLATIGLLWIRRPWSVRIVQAVLVLGMLEWLLTLSELVARRAATGMPYTRLAAILGSVTLLTGLSALVFRNEGLRERYGLNRAAEDKVGL